VADTLSEKVLADLARHKLSCDWCQHAARCIVAYSLERAIMWLNNAEGFERVRTERKAQAELS